MCVILYIAIVLITQTSSTDESLSPDLNSLLELMMRTEETCGKLQWCTVQAGSYTNEAENECCHRCFCDQHCFRTKSCCPDISLSTLLDGMVFDTVQDIGLALHNPVIVESFDASLYDRSTPATKDITIVTCISSSLYDAVDIRLKRPSYHMVSKCTDARINQRNKTLCESSELDTGNPHIADIVPVQSWSSGLVYRNKYCALCNGIKIDALTEWDIYIATRSQYEEFSHNHFSSIDAMIKSLLQYSSPAIYFYPNKELLETHPPSICHSFDVESCGTDKGTNQSTINACHNYVLPVYRKEDRKLTVYKNLACLVCNSQGTEQGTCRPYKQWSRAKPFTGRIQNDYISRENFSTETKQINQLDVMFSTHCEAGHFYDSRLGTCRKVYCPCMMVVHGSKCVPLFQDVYDRFFEVFVDIPQPVVPNGNNVTVVQAGLFQYFTNAFEMSDTFTAQNIIIWTQKEKYPIPKSFLAYITFSGQKQHSFFPDAIKFVDQHFRGLKKINSLSTSVKMTVTDHFRVYFNTAVNVNTRNEYKKALSLLDLTLSSTKLLHVTECHFCYHVELLQQEVGHDSHYLYATFATNLTGKLVCVDNVITKTDEQTVHNTHDNVDTAMTLSVEDTPDDTDYFDMLLVFLFMGLFVCLIIAVKVCLRQLGRYKTSFRSALQKSEVQDQTEP